MKSVYLDHAASAPLKDGVLEKMLPWMCGNFSNPDGIYLMAKEAATAVFLARKEIAGVLHANPAEIYFTSGGTESDNWAISGVLQSAFEKHDKPHVVTTAFEHPAVLHPLSTLQKQGKIELTVVCPDEDGIVSPEEIDRACRENTVLISVMFVNNEIGTIQRIEEIGRIATRRHIPFHTDAVQAVGHLEIDPEKLGITLMSASAHKFGGPKGVGFLYIKQNTEFPSLILGGGQESGRRGGTLNVPGIVGMAHALGIGEDTEKIRHLQCCLLSGIEKTFPDAFLNGSRNERIPGNLSICFPGVRSEKILLELGKRGICASGRAACSSASAETSHVLRAIGRTDDEALGTIRFSLGDCNTEEEMEEVVRVLFELMTVR